ncbi:hypothetical protein [Streptomyces formicae]|uniref:Uncharacterized protein n=1 Tax=Streptomyces formicae TaxID=1616117 RepID=A0A291Q2D8_9ACTN|nr:hypothetical protein [Streptomyces formicae]ATL25634.1 hypothetical protein KY5_0616c [Streptomyces formicae]
MDEASGGGRASASPFERRKPRWVPPPAFFGFVLLLAVLFGLSYAVGDAAGPVAPGMHGTSSGDGAGGHDGGSHGGNTGGMDGMHMGHGSGG